MKKFYQVKGGISKTAVCFALFLFCVILPGAPVLAQDNASSDQEEFKLEDITVTGSRIRNTGMDTPTPVTVVTMEEMEYMSPTTMIEGMALLPQFFNSATTQAPSPFFVSTGAGNLDLRGLQDKRTLQLLDGRRVVPSTIFAGPDINIFPEYLVRSVETVTGGASASYGTNAVAGVVNFILDTEYEGIKGKIQLGENQKGDNKNYEYALAGGFAVTDRLHLLISAEKSAQDPINGNAILDYDWYDAWALLPNPDADAGSSPDNPFYLPAQRVYSINASIDGILTFPDPVGRYIFDENGVATPFVMGDWCNGDGCSTVNGGSGIDNIVRNSASEITPETSRENYFAYLDYDVSHKLKVYGQALYGKAEVKQKNFGGIFPRNRAFTIYSGNPFLPTEIQQLMTDNDIESVNLGKVGLIDNAYTIQKTETLSLTGGFEYNVSSSGFFDGWQVKGYYQYGKTDVKAIQKNGIRLDRIYLAADAVVDPVSGDTVCNVTLTSGLYEDCVPINLFGRDQYSQEAIDWVTGFEAGTQIDAEGYLSETESLHHSYISGEDKLRKINIEQHVFDIQADGEIYEGWGAGAISMAIGYTYREETFDQVVEVGPGGNINADPRVRPVMANDAALGIRGVPGGAAASGNLVEIQFSAVPFARGSQNVHEVFDELLIPVLADLPYIKQLNFSAAGRWAKYSGSGDVYSWKTGLKWFLNDELLFRGTTSQDVRAANIGEKYDRTGGLSSPPVIDYLTDPTGGTSYQCTIYRNGSPDIKPEKARTSTVGFTYQPGWLEGFNISVDWYSINVKDNINKVLASNVVKGCYQDGIQEYCDLITREAPPVGDETMNRISLVGEPFINQNSVKAEGIDFEIGYGRPVDWFGGGESIHLRLFANYQGERSETVGGVKTEVQGAFYNYLAYPEWSGNITGKYMRGPFGLALTARYIDSMIINLNWNNLGSSTQWDVLDNKMGAQFYVSARTNYLFDVADGKLNVFLDIQNLFDRDPEQYLPANTVYSSWFTNDTGRGVYGDQRGRRFVLGAEFEF